VDCQLIPFCVSLNDFCTLDLNISKKNSTNSAEEKNYSRVKVDAYCFECVLTFISVHPWANSKWDIDQSERMLYFCYVIGFVFMLNSSRVKKVNSVYGLKG